MKQLFTLVLSLAVTTFAQAMSVSEKIDSLNTGTYEVPVKNQDLLSSARFPLKKIEFEQIGNQIKLKYLVPVELTGEKNFVEFEGTLDSGTGSLTYENNVMNCLSDQTMMMCKVTYQNLKFDQIKAEMILTRKFKGQELQKRMLVQRDFSTDPVGVIKINLK
jgi:hypothetical protein